MARDEGHARQHVRGNRHEVVQEDLRQARMGRDQAAQPEPEESRNDRSFAMSLRFRLPPENGLRVSRPATRPVELLPGPPGTGSRDHWREEQSLIGPGLPAVVQWAELTIASASGDF